MKTRIKNSTRLSDDDARRLTTAFINGTTSLPEEESLFAYYRSSPVAEDLEEYRQMMLWYDNGLKLEEDAPVKKPVVSGYIIKVFAPFAAALAIIITLAVGSIPTGFTEDQTDMYAIYEGSYIIRNGKKITDLRQILPTILKSEQFCDEMIRLSDIKVPDAEDVMREAMIGCYGNYELANYATDNFSN